MPSTSKKQHNLMEMIAHGGKPRGGKGPSVAVAKDFVAADKGKPISSLPTYASGSRGPRKSLPGDLHMKRHRKGVR